MGQRGESDPPEARVGPLGAAIAGTLTAGLDAAGPTWVAVALGLVGPVLVGFSFPGAATWPLVAGVLLAPFLAALASEGPLWLTLLALPVAAGFTFLLVRIGQRWRRPRTTPDR